MKTNPFLTLLLVVMTTTVAAQVPKLSSYPSARATLYLAFEGQYVTGTPWNWNGPINAQPAGLTSAAVIEIFNRVAEDYRPFDLNITTDSTYYLNAPATLRMRVIITPTSQWYGSAGGVSYVGSFTWGDNTPSWVFSALLGNNTKNVAEAVSHEAGHTLGLQHQSLFDANCVKTAEYNGGQGAGEIGWAPIMGVGYYENFTTWHTGPNTVGCTIIQNDFDIIGTTNGFGLRPDDHANTIAGATNINIFANSFSASGLINTATDVDAFKIVLPIANNFKLSAIPQNVGGYNAGANVDIKVTLMTATDTLGSYNPSTLLNAGIDTNLAAGTYFLMVKGVANMYHNYTGSMGFYALNGSLASLLAFNNFNLTGTVTKDVHQLSWTFNTDEHLSDLIIEKSYDGQHFSPLVKVDPSRKTFSYKSLGTGNVQYRLKAETAAYGNIYYSNTILLKNKSGEARVFISSNALSDDITVNSNGHFEYQLFNAGGQLLNRGKLETGINHIAAKAGRGLLLLHFSNGSSSSIEKLIKQ